MASPSLGDRLDRWIIKKGFKAGQPLASLLLVEMRRRLSGGASVQRTSDMPAYCHHAISRRSGYALFEPVRFSEMPEIVRACNEIYTRHAAEITDTSRFGKPYFFNIMTVEDIRQFPVLLRFALSPSVTEAMTDYFGYAPRLHSLGVFYSAVNDTEDGSQMFHVDGDCLTQLKCFVNIWDTDPDSGAFTFLPADLTSRAMRHRGLLKTIDDAQVSAAGPASRHIVAAGAPGSGCFVDTSRCLHQGSRARVRPRLVFQFQYVSRPDALLPRALSRTVPGGNTIVTRELLDGTPLSNPDVLRFVD